MAHDVFISYAHHDKAVADAACSALENRGVRCWIAPRDVTPGLDWSAEIIEAISGCRLMVLIYSEHSNESNQIKREVERAVNRGIIIVPFRIQDVPMSKALEYFISSPHWMDALSPPLEKHLKYLVETVQLLLSRNVANETAAIEKPVGKVWVERKNEQRILRRLLYMRFLLLATGILLLVLVIIYFSTGSDEGFDKRWLGAWSVTGPFLNGINTSTINVKEDTKFEVSFVYLETGSPAVKAGPSGGSLRLTPLNGKFTDNTYTLEGSNSISITGPAGTASWTRKGGSAGAPPIGDWELNTKVNGLPTLLQLSIKSGSYELRSTALDHGAMEANDGIWKMVSAVTGTISNGTYDFLDDNRVSMTGPLGSAVWTKQ